MEMNNEISVFFKRNSKEVHCKKKQCWFAAGSSEESSRLGSKSLVSTFHREMGEKTKTRALLKKNDILIEIDSFQQYPLVLPIIRCFHFVIIVFLLQKRIIHVAHGSKHMKSSVIQAIFQQGFSGVDIFCTTLEALVYNPYTLGDFTLWNIRVVVC